MTQQAQTILNSYITSKKNLGSTDKLYKSDVMGVIRTLYPDIEMNEKTQTFLVKKAITKKADNNNVN